LETAGLAWNESYPRGQRGSPLPWLDLPLHPAWPEGRHVAWAVLSPHTSYPALQGFNVNLLTTDRVSALHEACLGGHVACAKVLLENGAQVSLGDADRDAGPWSKDTPSISRNVGWTALMVVLGCILLCSTSVRAPLFSTGHRECMEILLAHEVDIDQEDLQHGTPLYVACTYQRTDCVKKLLELGANVNMGKRLDTPLHAAARKSNVEVVVLLTDYGANPKCRNAEHKCALDLVNGAPLCRQLATFLSLLAPHQRVKHDMHRKPASSCKITLGW
uniref:Uncharacterized protein n=1 Tax=Melopsittacus undulatus TaxID=13146 RepID=A0A8C6N7T9_MELUD